MEIAGDGSRPDFSDVVYPGAKPETIAELDGLYTALGVQIVELNNRVKAANTAKDALLSWAELGDKLVDTVLPIIMHFAEQHAAAQGTVAPPKTKLKDTLLSSIGILGMPAANRPAAITGLLTGLLG